TFALQTEVTLGRGQRVPFAGVVLRYDGARVVQQAQRRVLVAEIAVLRDGRQVGALHPSLNVYPSQPTEPIGTPSIRYGALRDLYASVLGFQDSKATLRFFLNPGVMWLWVGAAVMAIGGLLAAWPPRRRIRPEGGDTEAADAETVPEGRPAVSVPVR